MSRKNNENIDTYIEHFKSLVERLRQYELNAEDRILKKNILVSIIDAISRTTSNYNDGNRVRFTGIIESFGNWKDYTRVSAPHIGYLLKHLTYISHGYKKNGNKIQESCVYHINY
jgi:hypothetical protein